MKLQVAAGDAVQLSPGHFVGVRGILKAGAAFVVINPTTKRDKLLYIPGSWTAAALAMQPKAEAARVGYARNAEEKERDELARKLLVGKEV